MQLSTGPWTYNRFEAYEKSLSEGSKPDFLDMDGDGDKKEPMKKAIKEKGAKKDVKEGSMPPWLKDKKDDKKSDKKDDDTCSKCGGDHDDKDHDKKDDKDDKKPAFLKKESAFSEGYGEAIAKSTAKFGKGALDTAKKSAGAVNKAINTATGRKGMKEAVMNALMADGLVNNPVSAEIMVEHMSDEWFDQVVQNLD